jgi:hypothetical protein
MKILPTPAPPGATCSRWCQSSMSSAAGITMWCVERSRSTWTKCGRLG